MRPVIYRRQLSFAALRALPIAALFALTSQAIGETPAPSQSTPEYRYDEAMVLGQIEVNRSDLSEALKNSRSPSKQPVTWENEPSIIAIGWLVIALGEFSNGSDAVKATLFDLKKKYGFIQMPYWMGGDEQRQTTARFYSFSKGDHLISGRMPAPRLLYSLCLEAEKRITARSGFKFEGYSGPYYMPVD